MKSSSELIANLYAAVTAVENKMRSMPSSDDPSPEVQELQSAMEQATVRLNLLVP